MNVADGFSNVAIVRGSNKNYDVTTYTFTIMQKSSMLASSVLTIGLPASLAVIGGYACTITAPLSATLACTYSSPTFTITLPSTPISANSAFTITITNIRNPPSYSPLGAIFITTGLPSPSSYLYSSATYTSTLTNSISTPFSTLSSIFTPGIYGTPISLKLSFQPSSANSLPLTPRITSANSFTINTVSCNSFVNFIGSCSMLYNNTLQVTCSNVSYALMSFSITGITSTLSSPTDYT